MSVATLTIQVFHKPERPKGHDMTIQPERVSLAGLDDDDVLDCRETSQIIRLSEDKTFDLARAGKLKSIRAGRAVRFRVGDLREFIRTGGSK